ncbi:glutaminyl-peptide cyclotransferase [Streptomyces sp. NBC_01750]|uniref:glutaminyl-peptide cyclotransferase n=1 Tax=Streptomyces sp. NBC_01750 TaxID=2975928 RepID=UPI002DDB2ADC|nr:glutaminyl-peptide cyclotransferase [Streptomyces sp. NBC_01750]WSD34180.1 glutaminyl-peptide cyclotransferase [Streptomyces sp. NBC_01750]
MRLSLVVPVAAAALVSGTLLHSCGTDAGAGDRGPATQGRAAAAVEQLRVEVVEVLPHDPKAFTQGLEMAGGKLYESTGVSGQSSVRAGPPGRSPAVRADLPAPLFGEGITVMGPTLWQLTWQNGIAVERDARTLAELRRVPYGDEGWGVCHQRQRDRLVTSNGSSRLVFRDPRTLAKTGEVTVSDRGRPVKLLNELECVGDTVYANVWAADRIVRIDADTGTVTADIDAPALLSAAEKRRADVLNGIAAVPGTGQFLLTGKWWPKMFRVAFVPK